MTAAPDVRAAMDAIRRIVRVLRDASRAAEQTHGVSGAQLFVLQRLAQDEPASITELAARTATHASSVSVVVQRLVDAGLVRRVRADGDGRRREVTLTARGRALARRSPGAAQDRLIEALAALPVAERKRLAGLLARVVDNMGVTDDPATMLFEDDRARAK